MDTDIPVDKYGRREYLPLSFEQNDILDKLYRQQGFLLGRDKLFAKVKEVYPDSGITIRQVNEYLKHQNLNQTTRRPPKQKNFSVFIPKYPFHHLQIDLQSYINKPVRGFQYLLVVIDVFSRFAFVKPLKKNTMVITAREIGHILDWISENYPQYKMKLVQTDNGAEFGKDVSEMLKNRGLKHIKSTPQVPQSNGFVERYNDTHKSILYKYIQLNKGDWVSNSQKVVKIYNNSQHSATKMTPQQVLDLPQKELDELTDRLRKHAREKKAKYQVGQDKTLLQVGDKVRLRLKSSSALSRMDKKFSDEIYTVVRVVKPKNNLKVHKYYLQEYRSKDTIPIGSYRENLLKVPQDVNG